MVTTKRDRILIVDDDDVVRKDLVTNLSRHGCEVESAGNYQDAMQRLSTQDFDVAIIDLVMQDEVGTKNENAGLRLLKDIKEKKLGVVIIMLTAFPKLETLKAAEALGISNYLDKDLLYLGGEDKLYHEVQKAIKKKIPLEETKRILRVDPFKISYTDYQKLDSKGRNEIQERAKKLNRDWAKRKMQELKARWIVVCGTEVVRHSTDLGSLLTPDELEVQGKEHNLVPFLFTDTEAIEEISPLTCSWSPTESSGDYYPTIPVVIKQNEAFIKVIADFDTGAPDVYLCLQEVIDNKVVSVEDIARCLQLGLYDYREHNGRTSRFYRLVLEIGIGDSYFKTDCECFENWPNSGFCDINIQRKVLVGRCALLSLGLTAELDGNNKTTRIRRGKA
ncbi:response regulator [Candidatus Bathyarchaeota archaeon]|nr:response regulator [Candidatus Bathyarchaeota archaeon]